jgi:cytoplasmic iron level regulating protein YaaA (DUF328/UPF0246 family)
VPRRLFVLLPPSEGKESGGSRATKIGTFDAELEAPRKEVLAALGELLDRGNASDIEKTLRVHGALLERAIASTRALTEQRALLLPAWRRYSGVVWGHLEPATLSSAQRRRILVPSGLYGLTTAQDPIGDYRMKMNVVLSPLGGLATYWRPRVTPVLVSHVAGSVVVNLLPTEHATALDLTQLRTSCQLVSVRFVVDGDEVVAGHEAKAVKGILARQLLDRGLGALDTFDWQGWRTDVDAGTSRTVAPRVKAREAAITFYGRT